MNIRIVDHENHSQRTTTSPLDLRSFVTVNFGGFPFYRVHKTGTTYDVTCAITGELLYTVSAAR